MKFKIILGFCGIGYGRLVNLMNPSKHYLNFDEIAPEWADPENYKFIVMTDPQFGKYNKGRV